MVDEANLKVSNSPTNGYFLSAQSGDTGGLTWAAASGGGGGGSSGLSTDAYGNTYGGALAGNALTSSNDDNVLLGREAGEALNSGDDNVFIGAHAGEAATSISDSVLIGYKSGFVGETGSRNVIVGNGNFSIYGNTQLHKCTFVGYNAGSSMQNSYNEYNTYIGYQAGLFAGADYDVAIGREAGTRSTGRFGVFIGDIAGNQSGTPSDVTGQENIMIGRLAGKVYTSGGDNTLVGSQCGATLTTGSNNLILGHDADVSGATVSNEITLGDSNIATLRCNTQTISSLSDKRDKTDINQLDLGLDFVDSLKPVKFKWKTRDGNGKDGSYEHGFIAQDLQQIQKDKDADYLGLVMDSNPERLEASYGKLVPILVRAIQELKQEIKELKG